VTLCLKISLGVIVRTTPRIPWKTFHLLKVYPFKNPENMSALLVLDDLMDSDYSTNASELFTIVSNDRNIRLLLITQNLFHQGPSSCDISLNGKYIFVFKNPRQ